MIELTHYNDGKGKYQSHEIQIIDNNKGIFESVSFDNVVGYGDTYENALTDFINQFNAYMDRLKAFETLLNCTDALVPKEIDCCGKEIILQGE